MPPGNPTAVIAVATKIAASSAQLTGREREYVLDCIDRGWITNGPYVRRFEDAFAQMCGARYAVACSSGTAALHLAMLAMGIGPGDTVVVPALTYIATANAATYCGARVAFCDVHPVTWCIDQESANQKRKEVAASLVVPVHMYDALADTSWLSGRVVEDAAHAPGTPRVGIHAEMTTHSFYASKVIACGEGGMVTTNSEELAIAARLYRGQGATTPGRYFHSVVGHNYRMTDLQAALGLAQLEKLPEALATRRELIDRYRSNLAGAPWITLQGGVRASGWAMAVLVPYGVNRDTVAKELAKEGIETRPFFEPLPSLPPYRGDVPTVAASVATRGLVLPTHTGLSVAVVDFVCERLVEAVEAAC